MNKITNKQIDKAVNWWGEILKNPKFDHGDDRWEGRFCQFLGKRLADTNQITDEDIKIFKANLRAILLSKKADSYMDRILTCDYAPCLSLMEATRNTNIKSENFPWKTTMWLKENGTVELRYGYGQSIQTI